MYARADALPEGSVVAHTTSRISVIVKIASGYARGVALAPHRNQRHSRRHEAGGRRSGRKRNRCRKSQQSIETATEGCFHDDPTVVVSG